MCSTCWHPSITLVNSKSIEAIICADRICWCSVPYKFPGFLQNQSPSCVVSSKPSSAEANLSSGEAHLYLHV